jgi:transposase
MHPVLQASSLIPRGLVVGSLDDTEDAIIVTAHSDESFATCPICGTVSRRVHSRYLRHVADLPSAGRRVLLRVEARRFVCSVTHCRRRIFVERFAETILGERARRTARLDCLVHHLGLALGGRPAAGFAKRLMVPVSNDTLLRVVRRKSRPPDDTLSVVGIDDWAFRKNHRYGTIVCDLERRCILALLPDREPATVAAWLKDHPTISTLMRDRGGGYGEAMTKGAPQALQVADRWHLMENASAAFLDAVRKSMSVVRQAVGATTVNPDLLTSAERLQYEGFLRREEANATILALAQQAIPIKEIVRRTGHSRGLVRRVLHGQRTDVFRSRQSSLEPYLPILDAQWSAGCRNGAELWRRLKGHGFRGSLRVVTEWATRRRRSEDWSGKQLGKVPSARTLARLMTTSRENLSKAETILVAAVEGGAPALVEARDLVDRFHAMIRTKAAGELDTWLQSAGTTLVASFARGIVKDEAAVRGALVSPWSNGQVEGQITKLKMVKRQMYGRGKIDLLQARLVGAP